MNRGFVDGDDVEERLSRLLADPGSRGERIAEVGARLDAFLRDAVAAVRERFGGKITYAAIPFERVDWSPFDFTTVELIRSAQVADQFRDGVRTLVAGAKPVAIAAWRSSSTTRTPASRSGSTATTSATRRARPAT
jgi:nucleoside-diphosphate-sugar epimerase